MAIVTTLDNGEFYDWLKRSDNYKNNFSYEGANALQEYLELLSDHIGENIEFDPIAWCCEFSEYDSLSEAYKNWRYDYTYVEDEAREYFRDNTSLIELGNGHIIVQNF